MVCTIFMDHALHFIVAPCKPPVDFTGTLFENVKNLDLTRQKCQQIFSDIGLDNLRAHDKLWYSTYCCLEFLRKHGCSASGGTGTELLTQVFCEVWGETYRAIQTLSACSGPTSNLCLRVLFKVRDVFQSQVASLATTVGEKDVADALGEAKDTLDKIIDSIYLVWSVPLVLDPRYKLTYVQRTFSRAFGSRDARRYIAEITRHINKLYIDYVESDGTNADPLEREMDDVGSDLGSDSDDVSLQDLDDIDSSADQLQEQQARDHEHCLSRGQQGGSVAGSSYLDAMKELDLYLNQPHESPAQGFDILNWWKLHGSVQYPTVARMARDALAMPTCSNLSSEQMAHVRSIIRGYSKEKYWHRASTRRTSK